jgi:hypothetical protein
VGWWRKMRVFFLCLALIVVMTVEVIIRKLNVTYMRNYIPFLQILFIFACVLGASASRYECSLVHALYATFFTFTIAHALLAPITAFFGMTAWRRYHSRMSEVVIERKTMWWMVFIGLLDTLARYAYFMCL